MKNNKLEKAFVIVVTFVMILTILSNVVNAYNDISTMNGAKSNIGNEVQSGANAIIGVIQVVGMAAAVIMLIVLAIKYVSSAPNDRADIKKSAVVYIIGAVLLLCATGVLQLIKTLGESVGLNNV